MNSLRFFSVFWQYCATYIICLPCRFMNKSLSMNRSLGHSCCAELTIAGLSYSDAQAEVSFAQSEGFPLSRNQDVRNQIIPRNFYFRFTWLRFPYRGIILSNHWLDLFTLYYLFLLVRKMRGGEGVLVFQTDRGLNSYRWICPLLQLLNERIF